MTPVEIPFMFPGEGMCWGGAIITPETPIDPDVAEHIPGTPQYRERMRHG